MITFSAPLPKCLNRWKFCPPNQFFKNGISHFLSNYTVSCRNMRVDKICDQNNNSSWNFQIDFIYITCKACDAIHSWGAKLRVWHFHFESKYVEKISIKDVSDASGIKEYFLHLWFNGSLGMIIQNWFQRSECRYLTLHALTFSPTLSCWLDRKWQYRKIFFIALVSVDAISKISKTFSSSWG